MSTLRHREVRDLQSLKENSNPITCDDDDDMSDCSEASCSRIAKRCKA